MIESIYEKIKKDFEFLKDFGYNTCSDEHHYIFPSVVFHSQKESIQIGMNYEEKKNVCMVLFVPQTTYWN